MAHIFRLAHGDRLCIPVPFYHCFGMVMSSLACLTQGATGKIQKFKMRKISIQELGLEAAEAVETA